MNLLLALAIIADGSHLETLGTSASVTILDGGKPIRVDVLDGNGAPNVRTSTFVIDPMGNLIQFDPTSRRVVIHWTGIWKHSFW